MIFLTSNLKQPNIIINSGVHPSLHPNCHHQIVYSKINLLIEYPPPYERIVWDYKKANVAHLNLAISLFDWEKLFEGRNVNDQARLFNETLMNIFRNYIPNKVLTFNDSDPPWFNDQIKRLIKLKNDLLVLYLQNGKKHAEYLMLQDASQQISDLIQSSRDDYFSRLAKKLNNPQTSAKAYWKILKTFVNGKKIPSIPPLLENGKYVTNFSTKANVFNTFFAQQCTDVVTNSSIPTDQNFLTNNRLSNINFDTEDIKNIIDKLDPNKAHGHDGISIRMIQLSYQSVIKPLFLIYKNCIECSSFPVEWKKGCIIPIHKKR